MYISGMILISLILILIASILPGNPFITANFVSAGTVEQLRNNSFFLFVLLTTMSVICFFARIYFKKYDTQN